MPTEKINTPVTVEENGWGWILYDANHRCIAEDLYESDALALAAAYNDAERLREAIKPVAAEIKEKVCDPFHDTWNPEAHADGITLTIAECRAILEAVKGK